jgi:hypothetical protein
MNLRSRIELSRVFRKRPPRAVPDPTTYNQSRVVKSDREIPLPCGKVCGWEGQGLTFPRIDRPVAIFRRFSTIPKAMFLSSLTSADHAMDGNTCESALSSQNVRFAHKLKGYGPHPERI